MKRTLLAGLVIGAIVAFGLTLGCRKPAEPNATEQSKADVSELSEGNNEFALELFQKVAASRSGNICLSPYSIRMVLAILYAGAKGETASELRKVLRLNLPDDRLHRGIRNLGEAINTGTGGNGRLDVANALWLGEHATVQPAFQEILSQQYSASLKKTRFEQPENARSEINQWVSERTGGEIAELLAKEDVNEYTRVVLTNAIYLKQGWRMPFDKDETMPGHFSDKPGNTVAVPMMNRGDINFKTSTSDHFHLFELPYADERFAFQVLLPITRHALAQVERTLGVAELRKSTADLVESQNTVVTMPRTSLGSRHYLKEDLERMGLRHAFWDGDFSGISEGIAFGNLVHQALLKVDEEGTTAVAATATVAIISERSDPEFVLDQPYLYLVTYKPLNTILFIGRCQRP